MGNSSKKKINEFFSKPPIWFEISVWAVTAVAIGMSVYVAFFDSRAETWAFLLYAVTVFAIVMSLYLLLTFGNIPHRVARSRFAKRFIADFGFRTYVTSVCSAILNITYVAFGIVIEVLFIRSIWLGALVGYHFVLACCRAIVFFYVKRRIKHGDRDKIRIKAYIFSGIMLIVIALAIVPVIILVVFRMDSYIFFGGTIVYVCVLALYTVIKMTGSIVGRRRAKKHGSYLLRAIQSISLASALISVFALQATMIVAFHDVQLGTILNPVLGGLTALLIAIMGIRMIVKGALALKRGDDDSDDDDGDGDGDGDEIPDEIYITRGEKGD